MLAPIGMSCFLKEKVFSKNLGENQAIFKFITSKKYCHGIIINSSSGQQSDDKESQVNRSFVFILYALNTSITLSSDQIKSKKKLLLLKIQMKLLVTLFIIKFIYCYFRQKVSKYSK